ncbi:MAG: tetratricopeptide repeat protein, partial [Gammaproteobacteria bacterium]|nr:tetratricopeptide repeat protein [Gammaproteobacteria bacterium]
MISPVDLSSPLDPLHSGAWLRLLRLIKVRKGFSLIIAQYSEMAYRDALIRFQRQQAPAACYEVTEKTTDFFTFETELKQACAIHAVLHVTGLDDSRAWRRKFFQGLNYHREQIAEQCPSCLILWLHEEALKALANQAADFWAWRNAVLDFSRIKAPVLREVPDEISNTERASHAERQARIESISAYLDAREQLDDNDAGLLLERGQLYTGLGLLTPALTDLQQAQSLYREADDRRDAAICAGEIARIKVFQGDVDAAFRLHEERLQVFEALGDARSRAATLSDIARITVAQGDVDAARRLHEAILQVCEALGDARGRAVTLGDIAHIKVSKGDVDAALRLYEEILQVCEALGDARGRAVTLGDIAHIKVSKGDVGAALRLHEEEIKVYEALGDVRERAFTLGNIARIKLSKGDVDAALRLHEEEIKVYEALGDARSRAVTLGDIARIKVSKGDVDAALRLHEEKLKVMEALGDARSRAVTLGDIAEIRL